MSSVFLDRLDALSNLSRRKLIGLLDRIPGKKNVIIEQNLMKPLDRFIGASVLRCHGVNKIYKLDKIIVQDDNSNIVYMIRADLLTGKIVCNQINSLLGKNSELKFHIILIPKVLSSVRLLFEEEGLFGKVKFHAFAWELIQLDWKILSFEYPRLYKQLFLENDQSLLSCVAKSLWSMQHIFGRPPLSIFHGKYANVVSSLVEFYEQEAGMPDKSDSDIGCMIVMDRDIDYASVLLMPGTYTGLMGEVTNIVTGTVELPCLNQEKNEEFLLHINLTSEDEVYNHIKNKHFSDVNGYLRQRANELISEKNKGTKLGLKEMRNFVESQLGKLRHDSVTLSKHFNICEKICNDIGQKFETIQNCQAGILYGVGRKDVLTEIEDLISTSSDKYLPLRLICLLSLAQNGFTIEESNILKKQFLHSYGHWNLPMFYNLEKCGLFSVVQNSEEISAKIANKVAQVVPFPKRNSFQAVTQKLKLFPEVSKNYCLKNPQDAGYVFGGAYVPLIAQMVFYLIKKEMSLNELFKSLPGNISAKPETRFVGCRADGAVDLNPQSILVYIVGGITYAEIAALQFVEAKTGCRILCCGSSVINAKSLLQSAV